MSRRKFYKSWKAGFRNMREQNDSLKLKIGKLNYANIRVGDVFNFEREIIEEDVKKFAELTGDFSPLHMDEDYARATEFSGRIAHGMLLGSLFSTLIGMMIPGERALYLSQDLKFKNPFKFPGRVFVEGIVFAKSDAAQVIDLKMGVKNSEGVILVEGNAKVKVRE